MREVFGCDIQRINTEDQSRSAVLRARRRRLTEPSNCYMYKERYHYMAEKRLCKNKSFFRNIIMQFLFQLHKAQQEEASQTAISTPDNKRLLQAQVSAWLEKLFYMYIHVK